MYFYDCIKMNASKYKMYFLLKWQVNFTMFPSEMAKNLNKNKEKEYMDSQRDSLVC